MIDFILASGSPRRHDLLLAMGVAFTVNAPDVDESTLPDESPEDYVQRLSLAKAQAVATLNPEADFILAADTTVIHEGGILGKPEDEEEARRMLLRLRGRAHRVCTGFTILRGGERPAEITRVECTEVFMRNYAASEMERWISSGAAFDKAGGYAIQSTLFEPVERIEGSYDNVVGLPTEAVTIALEELGYQWNEFGGE